jgi:thiamine transport system substrate-binding protein
MQKSGLVLAAAVALGGVSSLGFSGVDASTRTLTVMTHDSFDLSKTLIAEFEKMNGVSLRFIKGGDAGAMLNKLILSKAAPIADVTYGIDNTLVGRAISANILEPYRSPLASSIPAQYVLDSQFRLTSVDYGFVALNYDRAYFKDHKLERPKTLDDLTKPEYKSLLVVQNPATSSTGLAFLLSTVKTFGEGGYLRFWKGLRDNDALVTAGWDAAYNTEFTKNGGSRPIVVSYASSPAAEVFYAPAPKDGKKPTESPTANLLLPGSSFLQIEGIGILKGTKNRDLARKFVDFMLQREVQSDFPTRMWVYPVNPTATLDPVFRFAQKPTVAQTATLSSTTILKNASAYIDAWTKVVVQGLEPDNLK